MKTKTRITDDFIETFTFNKESKMKNGDYLKINVDTKDTLISGVYQDDLRKGIWKYYSIGNKPWIVYDYENKSFNLLPSEIVKMDSFLIRKDTSFVDEKVDAPLFILGKRMK